jgi:hypothetical protein
MGRNSITTFACCEVEEFPFRTRNPNQSYFITGNLNQSYFITWNPNQSYFITWNPNQSFFITGNLNQSYFITWNLNQSYFITWNPNQSFFITGNLNQSYFNYVFLFYVNKNIALKFQALLKISPLGPAMLVHWLLLLISVPKALPCYVCLNLLATFCLDPPNKWCCNLK